MKKEVEVTYRLSEGTRMLERLIPYVETETYPLLPSWDVVAFGSPITAMWFLRRGY